MIPTSQEILYRIYGAWRLARFDAGGARYFDESPEAALRSFFAAVLVAPAFGIVHLLVISATELQTRHGSVSLAIILALYYCLTWVVTPVIAYHICQTIDRAEAFFRFLSASNWANVIAVHLQLVIALLNAGGLIPEALAPMLELILYAYLIGYQWFITRHCLSVSPMAAAGFVALFLVVDLLIKSLSLGIAFQPPG